MAKKVSELTEKVNEPTGDDFFDLSELQRLETLFTKNVYVLKLNLPSRDKLVEEIKSEIKKITEKYI